MGFVCVERGWTKAAMTQVAVTPRSKGASRGHVGVTPDAAVTREETLTREETFVPLAPVFRFNTEAEAVTLANATQFGLISDFYTPGLGRTFRVAEALQCGMVGIDDGSITTEVAPFGGVRQSGLGRQGSKTTST